jgi:hypothetical protein
VRESEYNSEEERYTDRKIYSEDRKRDSEIEREIVRERKRDSEREEER